jgi:3'-phosphoadenosine 5'-phosphosulfate sulfotransferase (PAPS reductase)/FAD synthetase
MDTHSISPKHEKFRDLYPKRLSNARMAIRSLGKLAHGYNYEAEESDWARIINPLRAELDELEEAATAQVVARRRREERARKAEGPVQEERSGFSVDRRTSPAAPWSVG